MIDCKIYVNTDAKSLSKIDNYVVDSYTLIFNYLYILSVLKLFLKNI